VARRFDPGAQELPDLLADVAEALHSAATMTIRVRP
jgi:hypothetical protein